jgi:hypothetical protein
MQVRETLYPAISPEDIMDLIVIHNKQLFVVADFHDGIVFIFVYFPTRTRYVADDGHAEIVVRIKEGLHPIGLCTDASLNERAPLNTLTDEQAEIWVIIHAYHMFLQQMYL